MLISSLPRHFLLAACCFLFVAAGSLQAQEWTEEKLIDMYVNFLAGKGYETEVDADGDVRFVEDGKTYFIDVAESDPEYFSVVLANIWPIESLEERAAVMNACNVVNAQKKVVKAQIVSDNVWITTEVFVKDPTDFRGIFDRILSALHTGTDTFREEMQ